MEHIQKGFKLYHLVTTGTGAAQKLKSVASVVNTETGLNAAKTLYDHSTRAGQQASELLSARKVTSFKKKAARFGVSAVRVLAPIAAWTTATFYTGVAPGVVAGVATHYLMNRACKETESPAPVVPSSVSESTPVIVSNVVINHEVETSAESSNNSVTARPDSIDDDTFSDSSYLTESSNCSDSDISESSDEMDTESESDYLDSMTGLDAENATHAQTGTNTDDDESALKKIRDLKKEVQILQKKVLTAEMGIELRRCKAQLEKEQRLAQSGSIDTATSLNLPSGSTKSTADSATQSEPLPATVVKRTRQKRIYRQSKRLQANKKPKYT